MTETGRTNARETAPSTLHAGAPRPESAPRSPAHSSRRKAFRNTITLYCVVALGTAIGGTLRAVASLGMTALMGPGFPWSTLFVNVVGSFVIGLYAALAGPDGRIFSDTHQRHFIMTGICGGFTTFSVFSLETVQLAQSGEVFLAGVNVGISIAAWLVAAWLGHALASRLNRLGGM